MSTPTEKAHELFLQGYSCAQSVFAAFAEELGIEKSVALKISSPFGAGLGRLRGTCGAFSGAVMVNGMLNGNDTPDPVVKEYVYQKIHQMADEFRTQFGVLECKKLLRLEDDYVVSPKPDVRNDEYYANRPCEECVIFCAQLAEKLLKETSWY